MSDRMIIGGRIGQGRSERIAYTLDTTAWGGTPTSVSVAVYRVNIDGTYTDVTLAVMPTNSPTVSGDDITLSHLRDLTPSTLYRIEVTFTSGGQVQQPWMFVRGKR